MSLMLRVQLRPYQVIRPFVFNGMSFEPGNVFDPKKAGCDLPKLDRLVSNRYLDATVLPEEKKGKAVYREPEPVVVPEETVTPEEPVEVPVVVSEEPKQEGVEEEQPTITRARRRNY